MLPMLCVGFSPMKGFLPKFSISFVFWSYFLLIIVHSFWLVFLEIFSSKHLMKICEITLEFKKKYWLILKQESKMIHYFWSEKKNEKQRNPVKFFECTDKKKWKSMKKIIHLNLFPNSQIDLTGNLWFWFLPLNSPKVW